MSAMYFLGKIYVRGYGTDKDVQKAMECFRPPAENGDARAQYSLGLIYFDGRT